MAASTQSRAGPVPPATSTSTSTSGRVATCSGSSVSATPLPTMAAARARLRAATATTSMPRPARAAISAWLRASTRKVPAPTVPMPIMPTRSGRRATGWPPRDSKRGSGSRYMDFSEQTKANPAARAGFRSFGEEERRHQVAAGTATCACSGGRGGNGGNHSCPHRPRAGARHHAAHGGNSGCGGEREVRHEAASVHEALRRPHSVSYLRLWPRDCSAGYFCAFRAILARAASIRSMSSTVESCTR